MRRQGRQGRSCDQQRICRGRARRPRRRAGHPRAGAFAWYPAVGTELLRFLQQPRMRQPVWLGKPPDTPDAARPDWFCDPERGTGRLRGGQGAGARYRLQPCHHHRQSGRHQQCRMRRASGGRREHPCDRIVCRRTGACRPLSYGDAAGCRVGQALPGTQDRVFGSGPPGGACAYGLAGGRRCRLSAGRSDSVPGPGGIVSWCGASRESLRHGCARCGGAPGGDQHVGGNGRTVG